MADGCDPVACTELSHAGALRKHGLLVCRVPAVIADRLMACQRTARQASAKRPCRSPCSCQDHRGFRL